MTKNSQNVQKNFSDLRKGNELNEVWQRLAREELSWYLEYITSGNWKPAEHLTLLCDKLEAVERGDLKRLMVFMPPRHGKSEVISRGFPPWYLGRNPNKEIILSSYAADLAYDFSRNARNRMRDHSEEIFGKHLAADSKSVKSWHIADHKGGFHAAGVGGPITGKGADVAVIDDPVKNWEEAQSDTVREKVWNWYRSTLRTRLSPEGAIVLVMTRWHEHDLAGKLLATQSEDWEILELPALAKKEDPLGRDPGEPLWPERYDKKKLDQIRKESGERMWKPLYQQIPPEASEAALWDIENIEKNRVRDYPELKRIVIGVDPAVSDTSESDMTGIVVAGIDHRDEFYVLEDATIKAKPLRWANKVVDLYEDYEADKVVAETNQGGDLVESNLRTVDSSVSYEEVKASRGKYIRAEPVSSLYEKDEVHHVNVLEKLEKQLTEWQPGSSSPDRLDALVWALTNLMENKESQSQAFIL